MVAVFRYGGKQYIAQTGLHLKLERVEGEEGDTVEFSDVLSYKEANEFIVGNPTINNALIKAEIVSQARDKKVIIFKKKRRKNYRRTKGHRQNITIVKILSMGVN